MLNLRTGYMAFQLIDSIFLVLYWVIIARAFLSFAPLFRMKHYQFSRIVYQITDPFMIPLEKFMYKHVHLGQVDISPLVAIILLQVLKQFLFKILYLLMI